VSPDARILVVDDNALNLTVAQGFLARHGVRAETAAGGEEAVEKIRSTHYDLVFMDHMMPDVDGIEAVRRVRAIPGEYYAALPIVALSANAVLEVRDLFFQAGMNGFIAKPIDADELNVALARWLPAEKILGEGVEERVEEASPNSGKPDEILARLRNIADLDVNTGLARTLDDRRTYTDILRQFCAGLDKDLADIRAFLENGDWKAYSIRLHALKSVFANFGNQRMTERAFALENASANGDTATCLQRTHDFCQDMEMFRAQLLAAGLAQSEDPAAGTPITNSELALKLNILERACLDCHADEANRVADELRQATLDPETDALLMNITGLVESFDYDAAAAECGTLIAMLGKC
jgi:CheY-like chemotaxis protein/HPt (histidine-containing phosphotransfer) domain-containing protein